MSKKRYTLELMFGDADAYTTQDYTTDKPEEIQFLDVFLPNFNESWSSLRDYDEIEISQELVDGLNQTLEALKPYMAANNRAPFYDEPLTTDTPIDDFYEIMEILFETVSFITNWEFYMMEYTGKPCSYKIESTDIKKEMTVDEIIAFIKQVTGQDVRLKQ